MTRFLTSMSMLLFAAGSIFAQSAEQTIGCRFKMEQLPEIKGFRIGMSTQELLTRYPRIKDRLKEPDSYGYVSASLSSNLIDSRQVRHPYEVHLTIIGEKVTDFYIVYDRSAQRIDLLQFLKETIAEANLPDSTNWQDGKKDERILRCLDGNVSVEIRETTYPHEWTPSVSVSSGCGQRAIDGTWISPQFATGLLTIKLGCPSSQGTYSDGEHTWNLIGDFQSGRFEGTWTDNDENGIRDRGSFDMILLARDTLRLSFLNAKGVLKSSSTWVRSQTSESTGTRWEKLPDRTQSFVGTWQMSEKTDVRCILSIYKDKITGLYLNGKVKRSLSGSVSGYNLIGDWSDAVSRADSGKFVFTLVNTASFTPGSDNYFLVVNFSSQQTENENLVLAPQPVANNSADYALDLKTFDALTPSEQSRLLTKRGPALPKEYSTNDLSLRAFVRGNWPVWVDYGLDADASAELTISVENAPPLKVGLDAAERAQVTITIPGNFGIAPRVGRVNIRAFTASGQAANFRLYGISMGEKGREAISSTTIPLQPEAHIAANHFTATALLSDRRHGVFFLNEQQNLAQLQITVDPTVLNTRSAPRKDISFSFTFRSAFSNGKWEIWKESGLNCFQVWNKSTGSISRNQTKSQRWNGRIPPRKTFSIGTHAILLTVWHGRKSAKDWFMIRTKPGMIVVE